MMSVSDFQCMRLFPTLRFLTLCIQTTMPKEKHDELLMDLCFKKVRLVLLPFLTLILLLLFQFRLGRGEKKYKDKTCYLTYTVKDNDYSFRKI